MLSFAMLYRPPAPSDLPALNAMILRSKAYWGYDADFMAACEAELSLTPAHLAAGQYQGAYDGEIPVGLAGLEVEGAGLGLSHLFVDPDYFGKGVGRALMDWALSRARLSACPQIIIHADPGARGFYESLGGVYQGEVKSGSIEGRSLPCLTLPTGA